MGNRIFLVTLFALLAIPFYVSAAWWNPLSWSFTKSQANISETLQCEPQIIEKVVERVVEVEKPGTGSTVYKDNPAQAKTIQELQGQIAELNGMIRSYKEQVATLIDELAVKKVLQEEAKPVIPIQITSSATSEAKILYRDEQARIGDFTVSNNTGETLYLKRVFLHFKGNALREGMSLQVTMSASNGSIFTTCQPFFRPFPDYTTECLVDFNIPLAYKGYFSVSSNDNKTFPFYVSTYSMPLPNFAG